MSDFDLNDMVDFFQAGGVEVLTADEDGVKPVPKKRNGLSDSYVAGKRKHTFTESDLKREIKYMDIRAYCLKKMKVSQEFRDKHWQVTDDNLKVYMQGLFDACEDFLGWCEGRIDNE